MVNMETRLSIDRFEGMLKLAVQGCKVLSEEMDAVVRAWMEDLVDKVKVGRGEGQQSSGRRIQGEVDGMDIG